MNRKKRTGFPSCFGGSTARLCCSLGESLHSLIAYDRLDLEEDEAAPQLIRLGDQISTPGSPLKRVKSLPFKLIGSKDTVAAKLRNLYDHVLDALKKSGPHISDLFVGNHLLMHVTAISLSKQPNSMVPSAGLVGNSCVRKMKSMEGGLQGNMQQFWRKCFGKDGKPLE